MVKQARFSLLVAVVALALFGAACTPSESDDGGSVAVDAVATEVPTTAEEPEEEAAPEPTAEPDAMDDGGTDDSAMEEEPAEEEAAPLTASWRGVTEDTITVGVSMLDFEALAALNLVEAGWGNQQLVWETYIADLNARGGINGRMVEAHYSYYSPIDNEGSEDTCIELTQDIESFAVLGGFLGPTSSINTCVTATNNTILINGEMTPERLAEATAPWVQASAMTDRELELFLSLLAADGRMEGRNVAVVGSVEFAEVADRAPDLLAVHGITPVTVINNDVSQGDIQGNNDAWSVWGERIAADGADTVLVIGSGQAALRGIANAGLDVETWVLRDEDLSNLGAETPKEFAHGAITILGMTEQERYDHDVSVACREKFVAANPDVEIFSPDDIASDQEQWFKGLVSYCAWLGIFELIATEAGPT